LSPSPEPRVPPPVVKAFAEVHPAAFYDPMTFASRSTPTSSFALWYSF
jgi:hypothetical protein